MFKKRVVCCFVVDDDRRRCSGIVMILLIIPSILKCIHLFFSNDTVELLLMTIMIRMKIMIIILIRYIKVNYLSSFFSSSLW